MKNRKKIRKIFRKKIFGVEKSKFANRLKRALPKFRGDRSEVRGVNGRSKFAVAAVRKVFRAKSIWTRRIAFHAFCFHATPGADAPQHLVTTRLSIVPCCMKAKSMKKNLCDEASCNVTKEVIKNL